MHYEQFQDGTVKCIEDEIPFDVPEGWAWARISSISEEIFAGGDKPENFSKEQNEECPYAIYSNAVEDDGLYGFTDIPRVVKPSITVSGRGTIGFSCVRYIPFFPIVRLITITPSSLILLEFLDFVFKRLLETGTGSSIPQLTVPMVKPKLIPIPPLKEQKKIVVTATNFFEQIKIIDKIAVDLLDTISIVKSKILDLAIRGKLVPQDPNDEPASVLLERIQAEKEDLIKQGKIKRYKKESVVFKGEDNSYYHDLPENWELVTFSNIANLISGRDLKPEEYNSDRIGIPYITGASNFNKGAILINRWTTSPKSISIKNDILLSCKGTVGELAINDHDKIHIARQIMAIRVSTKINLEYIKLFFESMILEIKKSADGLIPGISRDDILSLNIPLPPLAEQNRIVKTIETVFLQLDEITNAIA